MRDTNQKESLARPVERIFFYLIGFLVLMFYHMRYDFSYGDVVGVYGSVLVRGGSTSRQMEVFGTAFGTLRSFTI